MNKLTLHAPRLEFRPVPGLHAALGGGAIANVLMTCVVAISLGGLGYVSWLWAAR